MRTGQISKVKRTGRSTRLSPAAPFTNIPVTKLLIPHAATRMVHRNRLTARLDAGQGSPLTLLSAPAGYGKTTVVVDWLHARPHATHTTAWLSLDEGDNDPVQFAHLLVAALRPVLKEADRPTACGPPAFEPQELRQLRAVSSLLINHLAASPHEIILVLDDYHVIREPAIHGAMVFLLDRLPSHCRVIVLTREDPPFPLARLRAHSRLCELRMADLRFTTEETTEFLREVLGLSVSADDAASLGARTEGWIVGLKLAALSTPGPDTAGLIATLQRNTHAILDYLTTEVLVRQPAPVQRFLMRTSVLHRLTGPLCQAVLGHETPEDEAQALLEEIERANLFLVRLDENQRWYRYHELFADLLQTRLRRSEPGIVADLHRRASAWYETHGFASEAIRHALAAPDPDRAVCLIEQHGMAAVYSGQLQTILDWFKILPPDVAGSRPRLSLIHAYALYGTNQIEPAQRRLDAAEGHLQSVPPPDARRISGEITLLKALMAGVRGHLSHSMALARRAVRLLPVSDPGQAFARVWAARRYSVNGDVTPRSERAVAAAAEHARAAGSLVALRVALANLARVHMLRARLTRAAAVFAETEQILGGDVALGAPGYFFGRAELLRQRNDLEGAESLLAQGMTAVSERNVVMPYTAAAGYGTVALVRQGRGDERGAFGAVDELITRARERKFDASVLTRAAAIRAHLWVMQGNLIAADRWAETSGLSPNDEVTYAREYEYLVLARALIAKSDEAALLLLNRLLENAEANARFSSAIEILALRALAHHALGDKTPALQDLARGLAIAEPEGYVRVFVDEGAVMATLLRRAHARGIAPEYCSRLLNTFGDGAPGLPLQAAPASAPSVLSTWRGAATPLLDPLSAREADVLQLLAEGASNNEIARRLFVTKGTVKQHVHHILSKFDAKSRAQLIAQVNAVHTPRP